MQPSCAHFSSSVMRAMSSSMSVTSFLSVLGGPGPRPLALMLSPASSAVCPLIGRARAACAIERADGERRRSMVAPALWTTSGDLCPVAGRQRRCGHAVQEDGCGHGHRHGGEDELALVGRECVGREQPEDHGCEPARAEPAENATVPRSRPEPSRAMPTGIMRSRARANRANTTRAIRRLRSLARA